MDASTLLFTVLTVCLVGVAFHAFHAFHAWHLGNGKRDVVLPGVFSGPMGAGTAVMAIL